jgi:tetratricopeptide (TPR) repeat protein
VIRAWLAAAGALLLLSAAPAPAPSASAPALDPLNPSLHEDAAYTYMRQFKSPITGNTFSAPVLKQNVRVKSYDYDRCPHPPLNTLAYVLVIDPATGYVGYPDGFEQPCKWSADELQSILGEPRFNRPAPADLPWAGAYPWEKMENAARLAEATDARALDVANWYMQAAWAVRLDVVSGDNVFDTEVYNRLIKLPTKPADPSDLLGIYELQLADYWEELRTSSQLGELSDADFAMALAWLYRSRGELVPASQWLSRALQADASINSEGSLYNYLLSSIDLERTYLRFALEKLKLAWEHQECPPGAEGYAAFQLGEIERRLGDFPSALYWYDQAQAKNRGSVNSDMVLRQRKLVDGGRGY